MTTVNKREKEQRKRLHHFLSDLAILGSLQGFRYFQPWLRGREELLLTIINEDQGWFSPGFPVSAASSFTSSGSGSSSSSSCRHSDTGSPPQEPQPPKELQQQGSRNGEAHLLPASPSEREIGVPEVNCTLFLLAGYAKYGRPYAWIRSNHERLISIGGTNSLVRDTPVKLKSITDWCSQGTKVWDIVSELVSLCTIPPPTNPFSLDMCYLHSLTLPERFLVSGALLNFLETVLVQSSKEEPFYEKVLEEVESLRRLHTKSLWEVQKLRGSTPPTAQTSPLEQAQTHQ